MLLEKASISYGHCPLLYLHIDINKAAEAEEVGSRARRKTIPTKDLITDAKKPSNHQVFKKVSNELYVNIAAIVD